MTRRLALALLVAAGLAAQPASAAAPQLQVVGNHLTDAATGQAFVPRGANWPSFEYACFYGYAYSDSSESGSVNPDAAGARVIASWGVNTVRVPLNQDCWLGDDLQPMFGTFAGYRAAVQDWVAKLHAAGLAVILDLHWSGPDGVPAEGQRAMADDRSDDFWTSVATTFKDDRSVMFDAFNEPNSRFADDGSPVIDLTWTCWRSGGCNAPNANDEQPVDGKTFVTLGMEQLVAAIRATGAAQPILLAGRDYANDLGAWLDNRPADNQLVASFHAYQSQACHAASCFDATVAPVAAQVPVVIGEFGEQDCSDAHDRALMDWGDAHGVGYLMWAWWVLPDAGCAPLAVLADVDGMPRAPNGTALKAHLDALAAQAGASPMAPGSSRPESGTGGPAAQGGPAVAGGVRLALAARARQRLGAVVKVRAACSAGCAARATGRLRARRHSYPLRAVAAALAAGRPATLALPLSRRARRAAAAALRRHRAAIVTVTVTAAGATATRVITLTR